LKELVEFHAEVEKTRQRGGGTSMYNPPYDFVDKEKVNQWGVSCLHILKRVFGQDSDHYKKFDDLFSKLSSYTSFRRALGVLKAAEDDYNNGYLFDTKVLIQAEVFDDFLEQAQHLLDNGYYAPAAVIAGSVLEDGLRQLCARNSIAISAKPKLDTMNADLAKAGVYNLLVQKQIVALADLRNKAAHGRWTEFTDTDVRNMINQIRSIIANYF
jgi:hypothetical protein